MTWILHGILCILPRSFFCCTTDRILAINMISTMVICIILILSRMLAEAWLLDVALIYAMISLIVVTMLASLYVKPGK